MSRLDITLGLLTSLVTIFVIAVLGFNEEERMAETSRGFQTRSIESGAGLFDQYCATCHGDNAAGLNCPPLDETSGLHGGDLGPGIACRLEELGWDRTDSYGYVVSVITSGRQYSTRPDQYPGNRMTSTPLPRGAETPEATSQPIMAMPAWGQDYGGPLRDDQIRDIANYIVAFRDYLPETPVDAKAISCPDVAPPVDTPEPEPTVEPTGTFEDEAEATSVIGPGAPGTIGETTPAAP